ncbi:MAG: hypothetical protein CMC21_02130 [Flavobacteriaceae bacterium]|nr:hypothetical protein [Flavobacteriaceae bacterium]
MSNKHIMSICIDSDLMDVVIELKSRRGFSAFIQDCLRSHKTIIEAESLEHEKSKIDSQLKDLQRRQNEIDSRLEEVKAEAQTQQSIFDLEVELRRLNEMKKGLEVWESLAVSKRPKSWHEWNNKRNAVAKSLKDAGFDFSKLRSELETKDN